VTNANVILGRQYPVVLQGTRAYASQQGSSSRMALGAFVRWFRIQSKSYRSRLQLQASNHLASEARTQVTHGGNAYLGIWGEGEVDEAP
jgi:hypothetical protein